MKHTKDLRPSHVRRNHAHGWQASGELAKGCSANRNKNRNEGARTQLARGALTSQILIKQRFTLAMLSTLHGLNKDVAISPQAVTEVGTSREALACCIMLDAVAEAAFF